MIKKGKEGATERVIGTILIVMSFVLLVVCTSASQAQNNEGNTKEYVSSSPAFSLSYPADWVAQPSVDPAQRLNVGSSGPTPYPNLTVTILYSPLEDSAQMLGLGLKRFGTNVKVLYEKPSQLKDGAPAYEAEFEWVRNGTKLNTMMLATKNQGALIMVHLNGENGRIGDYLKKILYSLEVKRVGEKQ